MGLTEKAKMEEKELVGNDSVSIHVASITISRIVNVNKLLTMQTFSA